MDKEKGERGFLTHYKDVYKDRWPALYESLQQSPIKVALLNKTFQNLDDVLQDLDVTREGDYCWGPIVWPDPKELSVNGVAPFFLVGRENIRIMDQFTIKEGEMVLDMCAAPGAKALCLVESLPKGATLVLNEVLASRRKILKENLDSLIADDLKRANIKISGMNGTEIGMRYREKFDKILVDAPCSNEAKLLHSQRHLNNWTPRLTRGYSNRQLALLVSAFDALKPGGQILYTCSSFSPRENEEVIERLSKKRYGVMIEKTDLGEERTHGRILLPDQHAMGPTYYCFVRKSLKKEP